jgi:hypothetical protein
MGSGFGASIGKSLAGGIIILILVSYFLGAFTIWGLPKLWEIIKPFIHAITT